MLSIFTIFIKLSPRLCCRSEFYLKLFVFAVLHSASPSLLSLSKPVLSHISCNFFLSSNKGFKMDSISLSQSAYFLQTSPKNAVALSLKAAFNIFHFSSIEAAVPYIFFICSQTPITKCSFIVACSSSPPSSSETLKRLQ